MHDESYTYTATKDYIPGPGEYNIPSAEELSRHKRYGFLNHTNRFSADGPGI